MTPSYETLIFYFQICTFCPQFFHFHGLWHSHQTVDPPTKVYIPQMVQGFFPEGYWVLAYSPPPRTIGLYIFMPAKDTLDMSLFMQNANHFYCFKMIYKLRNSIQEIQFWHHNLTVSLFVNHFVCIMWGFGMGIIIYFQGVPPTPTPYGKIAKNLFLTLPWPLSSYKNNNLIGQSFIQKEIYSKSAIRVFKMLRLWICSHEI